MFPGEDFSFEGVSIDSWVSDQPMTDGETYSWAKNRVYNMKEQVSNADYYVGIEWGIEKQWNDMECFARVVIVSWEIVWKAKSAMFFLPDSMVELIDEWIELWEADDRIFGDINSKQKTGTVGKLTGDIITRTSYYVEPVILALIPHKKLDIYI
jgi:inosine/xanthosine triphosphatase